MKNIIVFISVLCCFYSTQFLAQEYEPTLKEGTFWDVEDYETEAFCNFNLRRYKIDNDTIIKNKTYKKTLIQGETNSVFFSGICLSVPYSVDDNDYTNINVFIKENVDEKKYIYYQIIFLPTIVIKNT